ncbi:MAG: tetratricopeptide repeat protein [Bryobacteraceae bacterium]
MKTTSRPVPRPAARKAVVPPARNSERWIFVLAGVAAVVAVFAVYGPALDGPFLLDDSYLPYMQPQFAALPLIDWMRGVRPLLMMTYWMNFQWSGAATGSYHLVNVILHLLNGGLIFLSVRKVLAWTKVEGNRSELLAGFAAGLFLLHPLQTESVSYVVGRSETLSVFFFLAAFAVFLYRKNSSASFSIAAAVLVLFGAACLSKEHAVVLPALLLLTDYYWNPGFSLAGIRRNWKLYLPILILGVAGLAFVWRVLSSATSAGFGMKDLTWYQYFFTECRAIWRYVWLFIVPLGQNIDHAFPVSQNVLDHGAILGMLALAALIAAAWILRRRFPLESYGVFTFLLLLAPTSSFVPIRDTLVERRMYLPFIGLLFVTVGLLHRWKTTRTTIAVTMGAILIAEAGLAFERNQLWGNAINIWQDSVAKAPAKFRPRFQLAFADYNAGQCNEAVAQFAEAAKLGKPDYSVLLDWALSYDCAGNASAAIDKLNQAAALEKSAHVYSQIGMEYAKQSQYPQALDALATAEKLDPNFAMTYFYRGNIYSLQGDKARAAEEYRHALALDPQLPGASDALSRVSR